MDSVVNSVDVQTSQIHVDGLMLNNEIMHE